jgi:hypothetical protein
VDPRSSVVVVSTTVAVPASTHSSTAGTTIDHKEWKIRQGFLADSQEEDVNNFVNVYIYNFTVETRHVAPGLGKIRGDPSQSHAVLVVFSRCRTGMVPGLY